MSTTENLPPVIRTPQEARRWAAVVIDPSRERPIVIVSIDPHVAHHIESQRIQADVTPLADVITLRNGPATRELANWLPAGTAVYGNAGRVYPTGQAWISDPRQARLHVAPTPARAREATESLINDALTLGYTSTPRSPANDECNCPQVRQLTDQVRLLTAERDELAARNSRLSDQLAKARCARQRLKIAIHSDPCRAPVTALFSDTESQFRHDVYMEWVTRIPAADKPRRPLPARFDLGPDFLSSLERVQGVSYQKVLSITVEILTGLVDHIPGRQAHRMRSSRGGDAPDGRRARNGAVIMRANVQTNSPSSRRIHYCSSGGVIELINIALHDDPLTA